MGGLLHLVHFYIRDIMFFISLQYLNYYYYYFHVTSKLLQSGGYAMIQFVCHFVCLVLLQK